jgi:hypothetical protein
MIVKVYKDVFYIRWKECTSIPIYYPFQFESILSHSRYSTPRFPACMGNGVCWSYEYCGCLR